MAEPIEMSIGGRGARNHVLNVVPDPPTTITASFEKKVIFVEAHACRWSIYSTLFAKEQQGYFTVPEYRGKLVDYFHGEFL